MTLVRRTFSLLNLALWIVLLFGSEAAAQTQLRIVTWNIQGASDWTAKADYIASLQPDIVVVQELHANATEAIRARIDAGTPQNTWTYEYHNHLDTNGVDRGEGNAVYTHLDIDEVSVTRLVGTDAFISQRAVVRVQVTYNSVALNVFAVHLACCGAVQARQNQVNQFIQWSRMFDAPRLVGGDFNATPGQPEISSATQPAGIGMAADYRDLWGVYGNRDDPGDPGITHPSTGRRIDYWFQSLAGLSQVQHVAIEVLNDQALSDHNAVMWTVNVGGGCAGGSTPFHGMPLPVPGIPTVIQAEDYDGGGQDVAYFDDTVSNLGGAYRTGERVDVEPSTGGGFNVAYFSANEWLKYTIDVTDAGTYRLDARVASNGTGGTFHVESNCIDKTGPISVPNTGGWQTWVTVSRNITLGAGVQVLRLHADTAGPVTTALGNLGSITLTQISTTTRTFGKTGIGTTFNNFPAGDNKSASMFTLPENGLVSKITVYFKGTHLNHEGGPARAVIYRLDGSVATASRVGTTNEVVVPDNQDGWLDFTFSSPVSLQAGSYYLGIIAANKLIGAMDTGGTNHYNANAYGLGPSNPFGAASSSTWQKSIYATYQPQ
jgi:endonuclease/exonuclease/phosphatase family metal-dependent hydrolase